MPEKEKKRKRHSEKEERPQKRVAVAPSHPALSAIKVSYIPEKEELGPVIASTPGISAPTNLNFNVYKRHIGSRSSENDKSYELLLHSSAHPRLDYLAQEERSSSAEGHMKHYVGVYDPASGELKVTEVHQVVLRSTLRPSQEELDEAQEQAARRTISSMRQTLGMEFGTKKAKKAIASITENAITPRKSADENSAANGMPTDAVTQAMLDSLATTTASIPTREDKQAIIDDAKPRPKVNLESSSPADVYPLDELISEEDLGKMAVKNWQEVSQAGGDVKTNMRFVAKRLYALAIKGGNVKLLKVLKFVFILLNFYTALRSLGKSGTKKLPSRDVLKKATEANDSVLDGIRRKFANGSEMSKWHVDKLIMHICALTLHIDDNFETDFNDLREDLRLDVRQMTQYYHELGCKVASLTEREKERMGVPKAEAAQHRMAKLRLPLEFPKQRVAQRKRR